MRWLTRLNDWVGRVEGFLLSFFLMEMLLLAFIQVVMRDIFNAGLPWADTIVRHSVLWIGLLGAALATKLDQNLTLEVVTKYISERGRHLASVFVKIFAVVITLFLFQATLKFLANERSTGEQFLHLFPSWYTLVIIPLAFLLIPFHLVVSLLRDLQYFLKGKPTS